MESFLCLPSRRHAMEENSYRLLAQRLDDLPNGFPATPEGLELELLAKLFTPQEAALAARLRLSLESSEEIAARVGADPEITRQMLKSMARNGLIAAGRMEGGLGYHLMPFVVGIYEMQVGRIDAELARLFEAYYRRSFKQVLGTEPPVHRVIPVGESVRVDMEIHPFESITGIVDSAQAWGVLDCICRKQKSLIGEPCEHPIDVCMALSHKPGVFDNSPLVRGLTKEEALATLRRAAQAGLVHTVSNSREGLTYICNCCTCSCGILRGLAEMGIANVVARSAFVNTVAEELCLACGDCLEYCQFDALSLNDVIHVEARRCVGCGVCVDSCPEGALSLARRPEDEILPTPQSEMDWMHQRAAARGLDLSQVL
jgi:electron transport complex protein RnfB